ncbi:hypothetical protein DFP93_102454 [Aneurinibacillus soli]|uniref:Uncharacterized protein n=1 Tax=Aneurinibacillus soli TaxID=1500254 RepID=A0A0U5BAQ9_9BACL|nr:hypothetical protein [Aneurinibacillus soli]PYE63764.1 hypothetical protein DFP93_102454 [Aneurinibacillus soli]BAU27303.1 hypothetical protein CB4_01477 [Aneurinibacillus soli]
MRTSLKNLAAGTGAAGITMTTAMTAGTGSVCSGVCGSCGFGCASSVAALVGAGYVLLAGKITGSQREKGEKK